MSRCIVSIDEPAQPAPQWQMSSEDHTNSGALNAVTFTQATTPIEAAALASADGPAPSGADSAGAEAGLDDAILSGLLPAFYAMEKRRMRRVLNGRVRRRGLWRYTSETSQAVIVAMLVVNVLKVDWHDWVHYRQVPAVVTAVMVLMTCIQTFQRPEHVFSEWIRVEGNIFVLWMAWEYDRKEHDSQKCWWTDPCLLPTERVLVVTFAWIIGITAALFFCRYQVVPMVVRKAFWGRGSHFWWRIRRAGNLCSDTSAIIEQMSKTPAGILSMFNGDGSVDWTGCQPSLRQKLRVACFSYRPAGWFSLRRAKFGYIGDRDSLGCPDGTGMWFDNSFHGECLRGTWSHGVPVGSFSSREYGTGAQFAQRPVAYATSRADCPPNNLTKASKFPRKLDALRYGVAQVEVSLAGGFFPFLPSVDYHKELADVEAVKREFAFPLQAPSPGARLQADAARHRLQLAVVSAEELLAMREEGEPSDEESDVGGLLQEVHLPIWCREGDRAAYVADSSLVGPARSLVEKPREALVFLHGFNSDLATCLGRLTQLCALGNMASHIVPFAFSYSAGFELSYFSVKKQMGEYGGDLAAFFADLGTHFQNIHILCHSCGAEFFFRNVDDFLSCFALARRQGSANSFVDASSRSHSPNKANAASTGALDTSDSRVRKPHLATLTLVNPDVLVDTVSEKLPKIMEFAEHFTTYNDKKDGALFWSGFLMDYFPNCLKRGSSTVQPSPGRRAVIFGSVVSPLWLESQPGSSARLRGPMLNLPAKSAWASEGEMLRTLSQGEVQADPRIDVIDCSSIDQNIHKLRHNYYMLNTQVVEDICELIGSRAQALQRSRLVRIEANVFNFLCPPGELIDL